MGRPDRVSFAQPDIRVESPTLRRGQNDLNPLPGLYCEPVDAILTEVSYVLPKLIQLVAFCNDVIRLVDCFLFKSSRFPIRLLVVQRVCCSHTTHRSPHICTGEPRFAVHWGQATSDRPMLPPNCCHHLPSPCIRIHHTVLRGRCW